MRARSSLSEYQRGQLVDLFEQGVGYKVAAARLGVRPGPVRDLHLRFALHGRLCLVEKPTKQRYSFEVKKEVVERFLAGETRMELAQEFNLSSVFVVKQWVRQWRQGGDDALKPQPKGRPKGSTRQQPVSEEDKLRRRVEQLEAENAYLKKLRDLRNQRRG